LIQDYTFFSRKKWLVLTYVDDIFGAIIRVEQQVICVKLVKPAFKCEAGISRNFGNTYFVLHDASLEF
jgi:hypothetical protein